MVAVTLDRTYVNLVSTGALVSAYTGRGQTRQYSQNGNVEQFAGGRFRSIATEGVRGQQTFTLRDVTESQLATLQAWIGQTVLVRDTRGRRMFGTYYTVTYSDRMSTTYYDVSITLNEVTYNEG